MPEISRNVLRHVARITIERPASHNALNASAARELTEALQSTEPKDASVIVLTGRGDSFCAGADLSEYTSDGKGESKYSVLSSAIARAAAAVGEHPLPVIAFVNGPALGGGAVLALACDLRFAAPSATFGIPAGRLGVVLDFSSIRRLFHLAGPSVASDMLIGARVLNADEAHEAGIFNRVTDPEDSGDQLMKWAEAIAGLAPTSVRAHKRALRALLEGIPPTAASNPNLDAEIRRLSRAAFESDDLQEGIAAFREGRKPAFGGH